MFLLDTNVVSELRRPTQAGKSVVDWVDQRGSSTLFVSVITLLEIAQGALMLARRDELRARIYKEWLEEFVIPTFGTRVLPIDAAAALRCAALHVPQTRPERDAFIAATALVHNLTVVTRNTRDFEPMGVKLLNPWTSL